MRPTAETASPAPTLSRRVGRRSDSKVRTVCEAVNVLDRENGCAGPWRKCWNTALETDVGIGYAPQQCFYEFIHVLAGLSRAR